MAKAIPITATGARGFLLWLKQQQPAIYAKAAPLIVQKAPSAFSGYNRRVKNISKKLGNLYSRTFENSRAHLAGLGDYSDYSQGPVTVDYSAQLSELPVSYSSNPFTAEISPVTVDYTAQLSTIPTQDVSADLPSISSDGSTLSTGAETANVANTGAISSGTAANIASAVNSVASGILTASQAAALANVIQQQLSNAQAGKAPAAINTGNLGIPSVGSTSLSTLLLLGGAGLAAYFLME